MHADAPVRVEREADGVARIVASSQADALFGLGHCHAVDRSVQMLLVRALGQGRGCELLRDTEEVLAFDRFFRRLNFGADAAAEVRELSPHHRRVAEAYAAGVNSGLRRGRPLELRLLGLRPEPWSVADCILLTRVLGYFSLAQSQGDIERLVVEMVQGGVPPSHLRELFPGVLDDLDEALVKAVKLGERLVPPDLDWGRVIPSPATSNSWALAPSRTARGRAVLASDPHLEVNRLPALWYEAILETPGRFHIGATMPGLPAIVLGRTNDVAWGVTYSCMDAHDTWVEDCRDGRYRRMDAGGERWVPFRAREERIRRRRSPDVRVTFYENDHGVLDGDPFIPGLYLASRWSGARGTGAATLAAALELLHAPDAATALEHLGGIETSWNWVAADRHGGIGLQMSGLMPRRREGAGGIAPLEGWDPRNDWRGYVAPEDLPRCLDPDDGLVVAANDDVNHLGKVRPINIAMGPHRAQRISEALDARAGWTVEDCRRLQMDVLSKQAETFMAVLRPLLPSTSEAEVLRSWDCRYDCDSTGAYYFERFYNRLIEMVFGPVCGTQVLRFMTGQTGVLAGFYDNFDRVLLAPKSVWFGGEDRDAAFARAAGEALRAPARTWGDHQRFTMRNVLLGGRLPGWLGYDVGPMPLQGTRATVHQGQIFSSYGRRVAVAASYRLVTDFAEDAVHTSLPGGPSERRWSPWYVSGITDWLSGRLKALRPSHVGQDLKTSP